MNYDDVYLQSDQVIALSMCYKGRSDLLILDALNFFHIPILPALNLRLN